MYHLMYQRVRNLFFRNVKPCAQRYGTPTEIALRIRPRMAKHAEDTPGRPKAQFHLRKPSPENLPVGPVESPFHISIVRPHIPAKLNKSVGIHKKRAYESA